MLFFIGAGVGGRCSVVGGAKILSRLLSPFAQSVINLANNARNSQPVPAAAAAANAGIIQFRLAIKAH